jgi:predicted DNA-binding transcriptional regulator AlpA
VGRKVDVDLLVDASAIAARAGYSRPQTVHNWRARYPDFPPPVAEFGKAVVWYWPDVEDWLRRRSRSTATRD